MGWAEWAEQGQKRGEWCSSQLQGQASSMSIKNCRTSQVQNMSKGQHGEIPIYGKGQPLLCVSVCPRLLSSFERGRFVILPVLFVCTRPIFVTFAAFSVHARPILVIFTGVFCLRSRFWLLWCKKQPILARPILAHLCRVDFCHLCKTADFCPDARVRFDLVRSGFGG